MSSRYGPLTHSHHQNENTTIEPIRPASNRLFSRTDEETVTLLHQDDKPPSYSDRLTLHFHQNVNTERADLLLLSCYVITGLLDSSSVFSLGSFASMQTGNTIYIGMGIVTPTRDDRWIRALVSVGCFCLGSFAFARYHRSGGARTRWVIVLSVLLQTLCVAGAATMVTVGPPRTPERGLDEWVVVPLALLGFQAAGQAYLSRVVQCHALTSVVLTTVYHDLFADADLFAMPPRSNVPRNQRVAAVLLLLGGAMLGGLFAHSSVGLAGALWTATAMKALVVVAWSLWRGENGAGRR